MARGKRGDGPSKMGLVRDAIAALGPDAKPKDLAEHIKAAGMEIPTAMISSYKSMIMKKGGATGKRRGPGRPPKSEGGTTGAKRGRPAKAASTAGSVSFAEISEVSALIKKHGASRLSDIIKLLS